MTRNSGGPDYVQIVSITSAGNTEIDAPTDASVIGIFSDAAIDLSINFNGRVSKIKQGMVAWEPMMAFYPMAFTKFIVTTTAPTNVTFILRHDATKREV